LFEKLSAMPQDAILKVIAEYRSDTRAEKIDLGVGVYRDANGDTPILSTVKKAEQYLVDNQVTKSYLGSSGADAFNQSIQRLTFGDEIGQSERITTSQTPGGSGSLRVAAGVILRAYKNVSIWAGEPTWANHTPLLGSAGIEMKSYPYYDSDGKRICFDKMLAAIKKIPAGDILLLHGCCHNPTGMDLNEGQWREITEVVQGNDLVPFIDIAYQGFANGLTEDAFGVRHMFDAVPEMVVASSCSKNFALYRDRVGSLSIVSESAATSAIIRSQANNIVRTMYSMPPDHGASVVSHILLDEALRAEWETEVAGMRARLKSMRAALGAAMRDKAPNHDFSHFEKGNGMFSFVGITPEQVERLKTDFAVYMVSSSRINIAGITADNVDHLSGSIAAVL
jgi:aspartate/tyrosine/aromatic aminotransferase